MKCKYCKGELKEAQEIAHEFHNSCHEEITKFMENGRLFYLMKLEDLNLETPNIDWLFIKKNVESFFKSLT